MLRCAGSIYQVSSAAIRAKNLEALSTWKSRFIGDTSFYMQPYTETVTCKAHKSKAERKSKAEHDSVSCIPKPVCDEYRINWYLRSYFLNSSE
jgi:hypothetical protein